MQVLVLKAEVPASQRFVTKDIKDGYENLQAEVSGPIEYFAINIQDNYYDLIFHEEGKLQQLPPNIAIRVMGATYDYIVGDVIIAKADDEGRTVGLTDEDVKTIRHYFLNNPVGFTGQDHQILCYDYS